MQADAFPKVNTQFYHPRAANPPSATQKPIWDPNRCRELHDNPNVAETVDLHMINFLMKHHGCDVIHFSPSYLKFMAAMQCFHKFEHHSSLEQFSFEKFCEKLSVEEENQSRVFRFDLNDFQVPILTLDDACSVVYLQNVFTATIDIHERVNIVQYVKSRVVSLLGKRNRCLCIVQLRDTDSNLRRWVVDCCQKSRKKDPEIFSYGHHDVETWWRQRRGS